MLSESQIAHYALRDLRAMAVPLRQVFYLSQVPQCQLCPNAELSLLSESIPEYIIWDLGHLQYLTDNWPAKG